MAGAARGMYIRLSLMMFLEFAAWGAWSAFIAGHMHNLGFTGWQIGFVFSTVAFGALASPLIAGWIADRFLPVQFFTAICHLAGAVLLAMAWRQSAFVPLWWWMFFYALLYTPTLALTNAIAFRHIGDAKNFGAVRVWGTLGWIAVAWLFSFYLDWWERLTPATSRVGDCLLFAAGVSLLMGLYCLTLPHTPPTRATGNPYAFLSAFVLTRDRNFAVLLGIALLVAIELPFYYNLIFIFLTEAAPSGVGLSESRAGFAMSLGQVAEVLLMLLLAPSLRHLGMRATVTLGILAWPVRYAIFAVGEPAWLVVAAQALHGICFAFFFVAGMIAVERLSTPDIRASAQALMVFATNGLGMLIGHFFSGMVQSIFARPDGTHDWARIFAVPIVITLIAAALFYALFDERAYQRTNLGGG